MKFPKNPWFKIILLISIGAAIYFLVKFLISDFSGLTETDLKSKIQTLGIWGPLLYIILYVFRPLILFPAGVLSAVAGVVWGPWWGFLYLQIAANISATAEFFLARSFARQAIEKYLKGKMEDLDKKIEAHGFLTVLLIRLVPNVAWDIQNLSLGLTKVKFRDYFLATLIGIMPGSFAFVFFGASLIKIVFNPKNTWLLFLAVLFFVIVYSLQRFLRKRQAKQ